MSTYSGIISSMSITEPRPSLDPNLPVFRGSGAEREVRQPTQAERFTDVVHDLDNITEQLNTADMSFQHLTGEEQTRIRALADAINQELHGDRAGLKDKILTLPERDRYPIAFMFYKQAGAMNVPREFLAREYFEELDPASSEKKFLDVLLDIPQANAANASLAELRTAHGEDMRRWPDGARRQSDIYRLTLARFNAAIRSLIADGDGSFDRTQLTSWLTRNHLVDAGRTVAGMAAESAADSALKGMQGVARIEVASPEDDCKGLDSIIVFEDGRRLFVDWKTGGHQTDGGVAAKENVKLPSREVQGLRPVTIHYVDVEGKNFSADGFHLDPTGVSAVRSQVRQLAP
jgi:hypothetical protein